MDHGQLGIFFDPAIGIVMLAFALATTGIAFLVARDLERRSRARWNQALAGTLGVSPVATGEGSYTCRVLEREVSIRRLEGSRSLVVAEIRLQRPLSLTVQKRTWADDEEPELRTVPELDSIARVSGGAAEPLALLDPGLRSEIPPLLALGASIRRDRIVLRMRSSRGPVELAEAILRCARFAHRADDACATTLAAIAVRAQADPDPAWRRRALEHLVIHAPEYVLALRGDLDREQDAHVRPIVDAVHASTSPEELWLRILAIGDAARDLRVEVIGRLAAHGSTAALPILVAVRDAQGEHPDVWGAAERAILRLRSSIPASSGGGLSLAAGVSGELALAESLKGAVSLGGKKDA